MKTIAVLSFVLILGYIVAGGVSSAQSKKMVADMIQNHLLESEDAVETRKTLDPLMFASVPYVSNTYKIAKDDPSLLDKFFCYCYCAVNPIFKHKSLLTCYVDDHASQCGICMKQAMDAKAMTAKGKTPIEISRYFKSKYLK